SIDYSVNKYSILSLKSFNIFTFIILVRISIDNLEFNFILKIYNSGPILTKYILIYKNDKNKNGYFASISWVNDTYKNYYFFLRFRMLGVRIPQGVPKNNNYNS
ncbi:MAG TPA: hypothetical protein VFC98_03790, partial [Clostridia bacterium]|nr:hypothetical protein [Clostridia bacterium]